MRSSKPSVSKVQPASVLLQPCAPETLQWDMQEVQLGIMRRAYELFEARNCEHGHNWEDWFQAESELLRSVPIVLAESTDHISVRVNVLGFDAEEVKVSIEPKRITILGRKKVVAGTAEISPRSVDFYPDQILRIFDLSPEVDPRGALVEFQSGVLKFELPKAHPQSMAAGVA